MKTDKYGWTLAVDWMRKIFFRREPAAARPDEWGQKAYQEEDWAEADDPERPNR